MAFGSVSLLGGCAFRRRLSLVCPSQTLRLLFWRMETKEDRQVEDARVTRQGRYSAWLKKAKSENARCKLLQSHNIRCPS